MSAEAPHEGRRFTPTAIFICGGILIWAGNFLAAYVIAAVACAKGWEELTIAGIPFVAFAGTVLTIAAGAGTAFILRAGLKRVRANGQLDASVRFIYFLAAAIGMLALIAILYNALPAWLLATECGRGSEGLSRRTQRRADNSESLVLAHKTNSDCVLAASAALAARDVPKARSVLCESQS